MSVESNLEYSAEDYAYDNKEDGKNEEVDNRPFDFTQFKKIDCRSKELYKHIDKPIVIREISFDWWKKDSIMEDALEDINTQKIFLNELEKKYSINMPKTDFVIGEKEKDFIKIFQVTDWVDGKVLTDYENDESENEFILKESKKLITTIIKYLKTKIDAGENFMLDIFKPDNYMYGQTPKDTEQRLYLVDLRDVVAENKGGKEKERNYKADLYICVEEILEFIHSVEKSTTEVLTQQRQEVIDLYKHLDKFTIEDLNGTKDKVAKLIDKLGFDK